MRPPPERLAQAMAPSVQTTKAAPGISSSAAASAAASIGSSAGRVRGRAGEFRGERGESISGSDSERAVILRPWDSKRRASAGSAPEDGQPPHAPRRSASRAGIPRSRTYRERAAVAPGG